MMSTRPPNPVPQYLLERLAKGDLPKAQADALRARLAEQPGGVAAAMEEIEASNRDVFASHPAYVVANEIRRRAGVTTKRPRPFILPALALGAVGALVVFAVAPRSPSIATPDVTEETIGIKGAKPHLVVYRKQQDAPERLTAEDKVHPADVLQVAYVVPPDPRGGAAPYGIIVSIDAAKAVTMHLPTQAGPAPQLQTNGESRLPNAYELDASQGFERFWLLLSATPFDSRSVISALQNGAPLPAGASSFTITFMKEPS